MATLVRYANMLFAMGGQLLKFPDFVPDAEFDANEFNNEQFKTY